MSLIQTLLTPGYDEDPDRAQCARAANLIQVGEFQFVQLAYHEWFGRDLSEAEGNKLFTTYMVHSRAPHWARHYARRIIALDDAGNLDDRDPAYHRFDPDGLRPVNTGLWRCVLSGSAVVVCVFGCLWISFEMTGKGSAKATSLLPPYFTEDELTPRS